MTCHLKITKNDSHTNEQGRGRAMKIAEYRQKLGHLERVFNVHRHACVSNEEKAYWFDLARRVLSEVEPIKCARASQDDIERKDRIVRKVSHFLSVNEPLKRNSNNGYGRR